jgi:hypothetical protein
MPVTHSELVLHMVLLLVTTEVPDIAGNEDVRGKT